MDIYAELAETLVAREPDNPSYQAERGYAALNLGVIDLDTGNPVSATALFEEAVDIFESGLIEAHVIGLSDLAIRWAGWPTPSVTPERCETRLRPANASCRSIARTWNSLRACRDCC